MTDEVKPTPATDEEIADISASLIYDNGRAYLSSAERDCIGLIARIDRLKAELAQMTKERDAFVELFDPEGLNVVSAMVTAQSLVNESR